MPFPKLSPLQSRLAASVIASVTLLMLYFTFSSPHFAYAAEVDSIRPEDHNHERLQDVHLLDREAEDLEPREEGYEANFLGYDRGIIGRTPPTSNSPIQLANNIFINTTIAQGQTSPYAFLSSNQARIRASTNHQRDEDKWSEEAGGEKSYAGDLKISRQSTSTRTVYISVNVCEQPQPVQSTTTEPAPQLQLYISDSDSNTNPGPTSDGGQSVIELDGGAIQTAINTAGNVYLGLYGVNTTTYNGSWSAEIAVSTEGYYHTFHNGSAPNLRLVDSDSNAALLVTGNLTNENSSSSAYQHFINSPPPYVLFASDSSAGLFQGVQNSYCGLNKYAEITPADIGATAGDVSINTSITTRGNQQPKQQFYLKGLYSSSTYNAILAMRGSGNSTVGGGGQVWSMTNFTTLSDGNCAVIFNLPFCDQTAYAVPGNPDNYTSLESLASFYDNGASQYYSNFQKGLAQVPCNTTSTAQYSLARNCDDCAAAYKQWLCAVYIPRCTDFSSKLPWAQPRSMIHPFPNGTFLPPDVVANAQLSTFQSSSRNPAIDLQIGPGPYKEILPCDTLCYNIVQSCPSSMQFNCPLPGRPAFDQSYGIKSKNGSMTCNDPGMDLDQISSSAARIIQRPLLISFALAVLVLIFI